MQSRSDQNSTNLREISQKEWRSNGRLKLAFRVCAKVYIFFFSEKSFYPNIIFRMSNAVCSLRKKDLEFFYDLQVYCETNFCFFLSPFLFPARLISFLTHGSPIISPTRELRKTSYLSILNVESGMRNTHEVETFFVLVRTNGAVHDS